jgi:hypothetical protein
VGVQVPPPAQHLSTNLGIGGSKIGTAALQDECRLVWLRRLSRATVIL